MADTEDAGHAAHKRRWPAILVVIVLLGLASTSAFFYYKYKRATHTADKAQQLVKQLASVVVLPSEKPGLLTIVDKTKLNNQTLAAAVENGDELLVYEKAGRIIIYRPAVKKIVTMLSIQPPSRDNAALKADASTKPR